MKSWRIESGIAKEELAKEREKGRAFHLLSSKKSKRERQPTTTILISLSLSPTHSPSLPLRRRHQHQRTPVDSHAMSKSATRRRTCFGFG